MHIIAYAFNPELTWGPQMIIRTQSTELRMYPHTENLKIIFLPIYTTNMLMLY
jgi:hypothetical protein